MLKTLRHAGLAVTLGVAVMGLSGCFAILAGAAAGAAGYAWVQGALIKEFNVSAVQLHEATVKGLQAMDLELTQDEYDRLSARMISKFADGKDVRINIDALTERTSKIKIRVGVFGDKMRSEMIYNSIQKNI